MPIFPRHHIYFKPMCKSTDILQGVSLLESAWLAGISIASVCGGKGGCGKCRIIIDKGKVSSPKSQEMKTLTEAELERGYRLACCTYAESDLEVQIPEKSLVTDIKLQLEGLIGATTVDPMVDAYDLQMNIATPEDPRADLARIMAELEKNYGLQDLVADLAVTRQLSMLLRQYDWQLGSYVRSGEIIGFVPKGAQPVGLAVDLGTTKIATYLLDLSTGKEISSAGAVNPQTIYGEDVMSRLQYACKDTGSSISPIRKLSEMVIRTLENMLGELTEKEGVSLTQVADICIVGNTAMTHLLLDLPVRQLAMSPYVPATDLTIDIKARDLGLTTSPGAYVHILPGIGGFVGADHVAMILATDIDRANGITLGVDIGTNTEIVIMRPDLSYLVSLSCPSGPAFEGAHVTNGMRASKGAIESIRLNESGIEYKTIGDAPASGLCGSGIIDAVAELYRLNLINERGRFKKTDRRVIEGQQGLGFKVLSESENTTGKDILITQKDIDEIQLAKGAIRAGMEVLMEATKTSPEMVNEIIIAGAFGSFINLINTVDIGLLPYCPNARYKQVGNGAGVGAKMALISQKERKRAQNIAKTTRYIELTTYPGFKRQFALGMMFPKGGQKNINC